MSDSDSSDRYASSVGRNSGNIDVSTHSNSVAQRQPIRPPTLNNCMQPSQLLDTPNPAHTRGRSHAAETQSLGSVHTARPDSSFNDQSVSREQRTKNRTKDKSKSKRHAPREERSKSRRQPHHPTTTTVYDTPVPTASSVGSSMTPAFRIDHYVHDNSPPRSQEAAPQTSRTKSKSKSRQSSPPDQQSRDWANRLMRTRQPSPTRQPKDIPPYYGHSADSPGPSVSEVMEIKAREKRNQESRSRQDESSSRSQGHDAGSNTPSHEYSTTSSLQKKKPSRPLIILRVVTLLIEDSRANPPDHQLAEVRIPLKDASEGFWADAKDICDDLQIGPARIDGPAKVYAMRGKYKQYFLRVTTEGSNDCTPANVRVSADRTLSVFVEHAPSNTAAIQAALSMRFQMHTPVTDPAQSPLPHHIVSPRPYAPYQTDRFDNADYRYDDPARPQSAVPHKRRYSARSQSGFPPSHEDYSSYDDHNLSVSSHRASATWFPQDDSRANHSSVASAKVQRWRRGESDSQADQTPPAPLHSLDVSPSTVRDPAKAVPSPPNPSVPSPLPLQERSVSPVAHGSPQYTPTQPSFPPHVTTVEHYSADVPEAAPQLPDTSPSLPGPSAPKKLKQSQSRESTAEPSPIAPPKAPWGAFGAPATFAPFGTAVGRSPGFASPATPSGFGASHFGASAFGKPAGFGAAASRYSSGTVGGAVQPPPSTSSRAQSEATTSTETDAAVGQYLRSVFSKEPDCGWADFVSSRSRVITMSELIQLQYDYVQSMVEMYVGTTVPTGSRPEAAAGAVVTKIQVLKAFNMTPAWGEECSDILHLVSLYGPSGQRYEDPQVLEMMETIPPVTTGMYAKQFLALLRESHAGWEAEHPESSSDDVSA